MADSSQTKKALAAAMKSLMSQQPFQKISVGDICEHCGMNRKSFYYHFIDKYDLVNWIFYTEFAQIAAEQRPETPQELLRALCVYLCENRAYYIHALGITGQNAFPDSFAAMMKPMIAMQIAGGGDGEREFAADFFADALVVSMRRWLSHSPVTPPDEYARLLWQTMTAVPMLEEETTSQNPSKRSRHLWTTTN